jgi:DNA-binding CsgD family transcriptional regulator
MWDDPASWQRHATERIQSLVGGTWTTLALGDMQISDAHYIVELEGSRSFSESAGLLAALREAPIEPFPGYMSSLRTYRQVGLGATTASELSSPKEYRRSEFFQNHLRPRHVDELLLVEAVARHAALDIQFAIGREPGDKPFSVRDRSLVAAVAESISSRVQLKLSTRRHRGRHQLSARQNQVLTALLDGDCEKEIAARLHISGPTVHEHVTLLYRYFGMRSRGELLAYFLRRVPTTSRQVRRIPSRVYSQAQCDQTRRSNSRR